MGDMYEFTRSISSFQYLERTLESTRSLQNKILLSKLASQHQKIKNKKNKSLDSWKSTGERHKYFVDLSAAAFISQFSFLAASACFQM